MSFQRLSSLQSTLLAALGAVALTLAGCSKGSGKAQCGTDSECPGAEQCIDGVCQVPSNTDECVVNSDCPEGICINGACQMESDPDIGLPDTSQKDTAPADTSGGGEDTSETGDDEGPKVTSVDPAADATGVALETSVTIQFSEAIDRTSIFGDSVYIVDGNSRRIDVSYDKSKLDQGTLVVEPKSNLHPATPYTVVVKEFVNDLTSTPLQNPPVRSEFTTESTVPMAHRELARKFAPVLYQGLRATSGPDVNADIPTRLDFDGDINAANNMESALQSGAADTKAHIYYTVVSGRTHYFLEYVLYYPSFRDKGSDTHHEHHFTAISLMVERGSQKVVLAEGPHIIDNDIRWIAHTSEQTGITEVGQNTTLITTPAANWKFEDSTHYPLYVTSGTHQPCHWYASGISGFSSKCGHKSEQPAAHDKGKVVLKPGDTAQSYSQATDNNGQKAMTYKLVPFASHFWMLRHKTGTGALFNEVFTFEPNTANGMFDRPKGYADEGAHRLPGKLTTDGDGDYARTPFRWNAFKKPGDNGRGQYILDPAYVFNDHFNLSKYNPQGSSGSPPVSKVYCYNYFFDIDDTSSASCGGDGGGGDTGMGDAGMNGDAGMGGADAGM